MKTITFFSTTIILLSVISGCLPGKARISWENDEPVPKDVIQSTRAFRERLLADPYRPAYHFTVPEDVGRPGDPNGAFYYNGRYHLMYLYKRESSGFSWGHVSSNDLLHWRHHPDTIGPGDGDHGVFSGGGFVDSDGKALITYWEFMDDETRDQHAKGTYKGRVFGIGIAESTDEHFDTWTKVSGNPVIPSTDWGITVTKDQDGQELIYGSADPSQIWIKDERYYMLTGNLLVLRKYGLNYKTGKLNWNERTTNTFPDSVKHQGDHLYLFVSDDLENWEYLHEFYKSDRKWTEKTEDNMCPSFLPLPSGPNGESGNKHLLLFISHNKGCQYYIGTYKDDRFFPESHGRMTWKDNAYFAPEALIDGEGRQIMWSWIRDDRSEDLKKYYGWTGTYGLPRSLWLGEDGTLRMRPVRELANLRQEVLAKENFTINADSEMELDDFGKQLLELEITIETGQAQQTGVLVNYSQDGREKTALYYDATEKKLVIDATQSSINLGRRDIEGGPFELKKAEPLVLRVFVDKSIVEVFANDRQAVARRVYPKLGGLGVKLFAKGGDVKVLSVKAWELMPSNSY
ncbi:MAG: hypothetical protein CL883_05445 [Dehalococcoidia bacterium]|nr:hypothetical protein [Dehalococcoidia bacterium]